MEDTIQRENLRIALLRVLDVNNTRFGLNLSALSLHVRSFGFAHITQELVGREVQYLQDAGLVEEALKSISPENRAWRIHKLGRDYLAERGF